MSKKLTWSSQSSCLSEGDEQVPLPEFVSEIIRSYGKPFANSVYRRLYDEYMALYNAMMPDTDPEDPKRDEIREEALDKIKTRLLNSQDEYVNKATQDLAFEKHKITYRKLSGSMRATGDWLKHVVPKSLFTLVERRCKSDAEELRARLSEKDEHGNLVLNDEQQMKVMMEINRLTQERTKIQKLMKEKTQ